MKRVDRPYKGWVLGRWGHATNERLIRKREQTWITIIFMTITRRVASACVFTFAFPVSACLWHRKITYRQAPPLLSIRAADRCAVIAASLHAFASKHVDGRAVRPGPCRPTHPLTNCQSCTRAILRKTALWRFTIALRTTIKRLTTAE